MKKNLLIAIDGPAGVGKSTTARELAHRFQLPYLDTGAMYRAVTWQILRMGLDPADEMSVCKETKKLEMHWEGMKLIVDGHPLEQELRTVDVSEAVSMVSTYACVRAHMVELQRQASRTGGVLDGRDIGTVVLPHADVKFFLTADAKERARRRFFDPNYKGTQTMEEIYEAIVARDAIDSNRAIAPLRPAEDAVVIDTTTRSMEEVLTLMEERIRACSIKSCDFS